MIGEETNGIQLLQQLMQLTFTKPDWYYLLPFICAFNQGDYAQALTFAERIQQFSFWGGIGALCQPLLPWAATSLPNGISKIINSLCF